MNLTDAFHRLAAGLVSETAAEKTYPSGFHPMELWSNPNRDLRSRGALIHPDKVAALAFPLDGELVILSLPSVSKTDLTTDIALEITGSVGDQAYPACPAKLDGSILGNFVYPAQKANNDSSQSAISLWPRSVSY